MTPLLHCNCLQLVGSVEAYNQECVVLCVEYLDVQSWYRHVLELHRLANINLDASATKVPPEVDGSGKPVSGVFSDGI